MARYTGPQARVSRRLGTNLFGTKGETVALEKRPYPPGRARPHPSPRQRQRVPAPAAGEAEGPLHLRPAREAVPQPLRGGQPPAGRHRREPAPLARAAPRQRRVPRRLGAPPAPRPASSSATATSTVNGKRVDIPCYRVRKGDVVTPARQGPGDDRRPVEHATSSTARPRRGSSPATAAHSVTVRELPAARADRRARARAAHRRALLQVVDRRRVTPPPTAPLRHERDPR